MVTSHIPRMWDAPYFAFLTPSDRLRILADVIRHDGPTPEALTALDALADELEPSDPGPAPGGDAEALRPHCSAGVLVVHVGSHASTAVLVPNRPLFPRPVASRATWPEPSSNLQ